MKKPDNRFLKIFEEDEIIKKRVDNFELKGQDLWNLEIKLSWKNVGSIEILNASMYDFWAVKEWFERLWPRSKSLLPLFPCDKRIDKYVAAHLKRNDLKKDAIYNAWLKDRIIGHFFIWNISNDKSEIGVGISDEYQNKKLGHLLIKILIFIAKSFGKKELYLTTALDNDAAFKLYERIGFKYLGDVDHFLPGYDYKTIEREMKLEL
jgi:RimJ/RimL family protein N-acetyltransferase